jgi:hypothetical protein
MACLVMMYVSQTKEWLMYMYDLLSPSFESTEKQQFKLNFWATTISMVQVHAD